MRERILFYFIFILFYFTLLDGSKIVSLLCVMTLMNNMQCVRILLMHAN